jgi:L-malate glycosyltransferase
MPFKPRPISLLHFSNVLVRGGAEEHILILLRGLDRRYFRLHLVCTPEVAQKIRSDVPEDVELLPLTLRKPLHVAAASRLAEILRTRQVDILHSHLFYSSVFASPIGRLCRVPVILETPHVREEWRKGWLKSRFWIDRLLGRFVDYYLANCDANARYLIDRKGLPVRKVVVIYHGANLKRFDPDRPVPLQLKRSLAFRDTDPVILVIGRLEPQKGHRVLLDAMQLVHGEFECARLICVGEGRLRSQLEDYASRLGLHTHVRFVGQQSNVPDWLALADLTVLPSFYEGLPLVSIESLAAERAVVATSVDGVPEVVVDGQTGLTVPPGDATRLAEAICRLLRDPQLRHAFAHSGRTWVLERFTEERLVQETQDFYLDVWTKSMGKTAPATTGLSARL